MQVEYRRDIPKIHTRGGLVEDKRYLCELFAKSKRFEND